jgi:glycosyltransferase involved in cell wall biosynthesis
MGSRAEYMKILMVAPEPFLEPRGTPISIYERLTGLSTLGHKVDLVTYHLGQDVTIPNVRIIRIPAPPSIKEIRIGPSPAKLWLDLLLFLKTIQVLLGNRYDVIHTHEEAAYFSIFLSKLFNIPHLYDMHSSLPKQIRITKFRKYKWAVWLFDQLEKIVLNHSDAVIAIAPELEEYIRKINPKATVTIIENLALPDLYSDSSTFDKEELIERLNLSGKTPVVYTGNFEPYQGLELLVESAEIICRQNDKAVFVLVGGRPQQIVELSTKIKNKGINDRFIFTGRVPPDQISKYLEIARVFVSPRSEGLPVPLKIYSYLYTGKPVLATNISAHQGFSSYENLILANPQPSAFAAGLIKAIERSDLPPAEGFTAKKKQIAAEKLSLYLSLIERSYESMNRSKKLIPTSK